MIFNFLHNATDQFWKLSVHCLSLLKTKRSSMLQGRAGANQQK